MKRRIATTLIATALSVGAFGALPAAQASTSTDSDSTVTAYSAMTDILSCKYYPTRPWC